MRLIYSVTTGSVTILAPCSTCCEYCAAHGHLLVQRVPVPHALVATDVAIADGVDVIERVFRGSIFLWLIRQVLTVGAGRTLRGTLAGRVGRTRSLCGRTLALRYAARNQQHGESAETEKTRCGTHDVHLLGLDPARETRCLGSPWPCLINPNLAGLLPGHSFYSRPLWEQSPPDISVYGRSPDSDVTVLMKGSRILPFEFQILRVRARFQSSLRCQL